MFADSVLAVCEEADLKKVKGVAVYRFDENSSSGNPWKLVQEFGIGDFHEIEILRGTWHPETSAYDRFDYGEEPAVAPGDERWPEASQNVGVTQELCRFYKGENCNTDWFSNLVYASEWHGTIFVPVAGTFGDDEKLKVVVKVEVEGGEFDRKLLTYLNVHLGDAPLPTFGSDWAYGDLHYHSQGTDNDGEAGYSYRGALHAMNAIGLDFAFATDHMSNSRQLNYGEVSALDVAANYITGLLWWGEHNMQPFTFLGEEDVANTEAGYYPFKWGLRDMSPARWAFNHTILNGSEDNIYTGFRGANSAAERGYDNYLNQDGKLDLPQMFLGGEVDVIPEVGGKYSNGSYIADPVAGIVHNGRMHLQDICADIPTDMNGGLINLKEYLVQHGEANFRWVTYPNPADAMICDYQTDLTEAAPSGGGYLVKDIQGPGINYARQHLLHLPATDNSPYDGVMSNTTEYGGASRRLSDLISTEFDNKQKGYFYLAHPVNYASGKGMGRVGPDIVPYSEKQLQTAFQSQYFLGLESWNEDDRLASHMFAKNWDQDGCPSGDYQCGVDFYDENGQAIYRPARETGDQPRVKDEHEQYLDFTPYVDLEGKVLWDDLNLDWSYEKGVGYRMREIIAGIELWDYMNLWGINLKETWDVPWLQYGEPRRVWLSGGSDGHGDFNHRREGYFFGTSGINDTAIGKPRNLVQVGLPSGEPATVNGLSGTAWSQSQIVEGLKSGEYVVTDGPIVRMTIDVNKNGAVDSGDIPMGGYLPNVLCDTVDVIVEWRSTEEFGGVEDIYLVIGAADNWLHHKAQRYVSESFMTESRDEQIELLDYSKSVSAPTYSRYSNSAHYRLGAEPEAMDLFVNRDPDAISGNSELHIDTSLNPMSGSAVITLNRHDFPVFAVDENATRVVEPRSPDRIFARAIALTASDAPSPYKESTGLGNRCTELVDECQLRLAFTNPVYISFGSINPPVPVDPIE